MINLSLKSKQEAYIFHISKRSTILSVLFLFGKF